MIVYHGTIDRVYHGSDIAVETVDPTKLQQRDHGEMGRGFYTTTNYQYAAGYGPVVNTYEVSPDFRLLKYSFLDTLIGCTPYRRVIEQYDAYAEEYEYDGIVVTFPVEYRYIMGMFVIWKNFKKLKLVP